MKRSLYIICLLFFALSARGVDYVTTTHNFNDSVVAGVGKLTFSSSNHIGTMTYDETVYTCMGATGIFESVPAQGGICIHLQRLDSVIILFNKEQLSRLTISHNSFSGTMRIFVSSDGVTWTEKEKDPTYSTSISTDIAGLSGVNYIKIKNTSNTNIHLYIRQVAYYSLPPCHCLRVVSE